MDTTLKSMRLLVEGIDDKLVIMNLWSRHYQQLPFEILSKDGFENLRKSIFSEVNTSGRDVLGIVADANDNPEGRWQSISQQLIEANCEFKEALSRGRLFTGPRGIRVGVWLMPDCNLPGEIEDFIVRMIPPGDSAWPRAENFVNSIPLGERKFAAGKLTRAKVYAWLATLKDPRRMGTAIKVRDLDHNAEIALEFVDWMRELSDFES